MANPFIISFGKKPLEYIPRIQKTEEIMEAFTGEIVTTQAFMLLGVRGSGKTVALSAISKELAEDKNWIVLELNPTRDMLLSFAAMLYALPGMHKYFVEAKMDLSLLGIGTTISEGHQYADVEQAISSMLEILNKKGKRVLLTIDEVTNSQYMREFVSAFQIFIRKDYPVFLIMTGLYNNIHALRNNKDLTFLYRTPKIVLEGLNLTAVAASYAKIFGLSEAQAGQIARLTGGYPFAFQVLGYVLWKRSPNLSGQDVELVVESVMPEYDQMLQEYAYEKIWSELSPKEKKIIQIIAENRDFDILQIRQVMGMDSNSFAVYRDRMIRKGVLCSEGYGQVALALPRFDVYVRSMGRS